MPTTTPIKSVVQLELDSESTWSATEMDQIRTALADHYGSDVAGEALGPPPDPTALRARLHEAAPQLTALTQRIRWAFDNDHACAVLLPELGLGGLGVDDKRKGVFALAALLGDPTANIPFNHSLWDVRNQGGESTGHTSFSENDRKAGYHTDNGALTIPERFFLLYAVRAAECGGGESLIRDGRIVKKQLEETPEGREAIRVLTETKLPRRIPKAFHEFGYVAPDGFQYTPVFAAKPLWRWRKNGIRRGINANPEYDTDEIREALDKVI